MSTDEVRDAEAPAISPDGKSVAYVTGGQRLMLQDLSGGQGIELFKAQQVVASPVWSPDGSELAVFAMTGDPSQEFTIFLVPRLGRTSRPLALGSVYCWSPDGTKIAVAKRNERGFRIVEKATRHSTPVHLSLSGFQWFHGIDWSPATNLILVSITLESGRTGIWTVRPDGSQPNRVTEESALGEPRWSCAL